MKGIVFIFTLAAIASAFARTSMSPEMNACRQIEVMVGIEFLAEGKDIPSTWNEIPTIQRMRNDIQGEYVDNSSLRLLRNLNSFAIVPNAPAIAVEQGISRKRSAKRLFAISRNENLVFNESNGPAESGRYAVLLSSNGTITEPHWIPEGEADIILSQIKGFDPATQPLAFPNIDRISELSEERKEKSLSVIRKHYREKSSREKKERAIGSLFSQEGTVLRWEWMATGLLIVALAGVFGYVLLIRRKG